MTNILALKNGRALLLIHGRTNMVTYLNLSELERKTVLELAEVNAIASFNYLMRAKSPSRIKNPTAPIKKSWEARYKTLKSENSNLLAIVKVNENDKIRLKKIIKSYEEVVDNYSKERMESTQIINEQKIAANSLRQKFEALNNEYLLLKTAKTADDDALRRLFSVVNNPPSDITASQQYIRNKDSYREMR